MKKELYKILVKYNTLSWGWTDRNLFVYLASIIVVLKMKLDDPEWLEEGRTISQSWRKGSGRKGGAIILTSAILKFRMEGKCRKWSWDCFVVVDNLVKPANKLSRVFARWLGRYWTICLALMIVLHIHRLCYKRLQLGRHVRLGRSNICIQRCVLRINLPA